jgi:hypothetical protein
MPGTRGLPRCSATTTKRLRCKAHALPGSTLCEIHNPTTSDAWKQRQREKTKAYWQTKRLLEKFAATASA